MSSRPPPHPWNSRMRMGCDSPYSCGSPPPHRHLEVSVPLAALMNLNVHQTDCINPVFVFGGPGNYSITHGMADLGHNHRLPQDPTGQPPESQNMRNALAGFGSRSNQATQSSTQGDRLLVSRLPHSGNPITDVRRARGLRPAPTSAPLHTIPEDRERQQSLSTSPPSPIRPDLFPQTYPLGMVIPSLPSHSVRSVTTRRPHINYTTPPATPDRK